MTTLRYPATGESFVFLQGQFRIGAATIHGFILKVLRVIWEILQPTVLKMPSTCNGWKKITDLYERKWQFPNWWGALDRKQIVMEAQPNNGSSNFNYKHQHIIILLAVCDANYKFIIVDVGATGRQSNAGVLRYSNFGKRLFSGSLILPCPSELFPGSPLIPQVYVADEAFPFDPKMMRPFPGRSTGRLPNDQKIFNYRLTSNTTQVSLTD